MSPSPGLHQIHEAVRIRAEEITSQHAQWPCRKGCDECCRRLASVPRVSHQEWRLIAAALDALPSGVAELARCRIQASASQSRPVVCPLLDSNSGTCLVYEARPVACRAYGFYAERQSVLGCTRIEAMAEQLPNIVWGNHEALQERLQALGDAAPLSDWLAAAIGNRK